MEAVPGVDSGGQAVARHSSPTGSPRTSPWAMVEHGTTPPQQGSSSPTQHARATAALERSSTALSSSPPITGSPLIPADKNNSAEQVQLRAYWLSFIKTAGIDKEYSVFYASIFLENELDGTMLGDIDHSLLVSLGVKKAGHRIKIIRFARLKLSAKKNPSLIPAALQGGKSDKAATTPPRERHWMAEDKDAKKKRSGTSTNAVVPMRRARSNSKENLKRSEVQKTPGTSPLPRREGAPATTAALEVSAPGGLQGPSSSEASPLVTKRDQREQEHHPQQQPPQSEEDEEEDSESESTLSDSSDSDSEADLDYDFAEEEETAKMFAAIRSRYKKDSSKEKLPGAKSKKTDSSKNLATSSSGTKDDPSVRTGSFTGVRPDEEALNEDDMELADEHADLSQYHEIKFFFNLEPTKRYLESTKEITGREFTEMACQNLNKEPGSIVVFTVNDNGEFVPLKEDDYIIRSEMHYVIESRKVSKDIKKLKERLKKEKPVWDSDNWPLMVDFVDSKDIYMAEHGRIGLCMCPGRKKRKKRHVWARDQYKDLDRLQQVYSCDVLVTLVREQELRDLRIEDLFDEVKKRGMQSLYLPIKDKWIPKSTHRLIDLVEKILSFLRKGKTVVVHCNGGKGRSATVIVACLIALGQSIPHAIKILQRVRKGTIRNPLQQAYLRKFLSEWTAAQKTKQRKKSIIALTASSTARERNTLRAELSEGGELHAPPIKDGEDGEPGAQDDEGSPQPDADSVAAAGMLASSAAPSPGSSHGIVATFSGDLGDVTQSSDAQPAPPSSEGEEDRGADRIRADTADYALDERNEMLLSYAGDDALGLSDDGSSGTVPTVPHLTPLEKKLMKVQKLIKKTEKRIAKKESMITKEKHHLDDLSAELKRVSAELKKEMQEGGRSGSFIKSGKSDKLAKSVGPSGARSPGPVRRGDGIDERDAKDRGREREDKEKERKERKEKKEKEKEDKRKEREEKERERREKEREKREKGREERERKEKEKEERKEKKKEEKLLNKKKIETSGGGGSKLRSREGSNSDLTIDYVAAASAALEAAELPLPPILVERPLSNTTSATVVAVDATKEQETDKTEKKEKDGSEDDGGDDGDDDDDNLVVDVQSVGASTATLPVVEESTDPASHTTNETTSAS